jgi:sulfhydrogenase subunit beta (sulfur reductase)
MIKAPRVLDRAGIDRLIESLHGRGFSVLGPTVRSGAIVLDEISGTVDLPVGVTDEQGPACYRLVDRDDDALFGYVVGPSSPKATFHPPEAILWSGKRVNGSFVANERPAPPRFAFFGVRPCEVAAVAIQDEVFLGNGRRDGVYGSRRDGAFFVVANCVEPGGTCFCASMETGPRASSGFDIALTEVLDGGRHFFLAEAGSDEGAAVLEEAEGRDATDPEIAEVAGLLSQAAGKMGRTLEMEGLKETLYAALDSPHWDEVAQRCLTCANCTLVCPTCFCATVEDVTDLTGVEAQRVRRWDSCFNEEFSYIHGGPLRPSPYARYRQWLTHKLGSWQDQFGTPGCVGCGRCITWCPVGIDITAEAAAIRAKEVAGV